VAVGDRLPFCAIGSPRRQSTIDKQASGEGVSRVALILSSARWKEGPDAQRPTCRPQGTWRRDTNDLSRAWFNAHDGERCSYTPLCVLVSSTKTLNTRMHEHRPVCRISATPHRTQTCTAVRNTAVRKHVVSCCTVA